MSGFIVPQNVFFNVIQGYYIPVVPVPRVNLSYIYERHSPGSLLQGRSEFSAVFLHQLELHLWSASQFATFVAPGTTPNTWRYRITYNPCYVVTGFYGNTGEPCSALNYVIDFNTFTIINAYPEH